MSPQSISETSRIADQLRRSHSGDAWHGPSVMELLDGVTAEQAAAHPVPGGHSIWEIVLHIVTWQSLATAALAGAAIPAWPFPEDWPQVPEPGDSAWRATLSQLENANSALVNTVGALPDARLNEIVPGRDYTVYFMLHGIAQHNLYHAGQIALLKKS